MLPEFSLHGFSWRPLSNDYFHSHLLPFDSLTLCLLLLHCLLILILFSLLWTTYDIHSGGGPSVYVYCVVCYCVIAVPYVSGVVVSLHTITLLMTSQNTQWTMDSLYCLQCVHYVTKVVIQHASERVLCSSIHRRFVMWWLMLGW